MSWNVSSLSFSNSTSMCRVQFTPSTSSTCAPWQRPTSWLIQQKFSRRCAYDNFKCQTISSCSRSVLRSWRLCPEPTKTSLPKIFWVVEWREGIPWTELATENRWLSSRDVLPCPHPLKTSSEGEPALKIYGSPLSHGCLSLSGKGQYFSHCYV